MAALFPVLLAAIGAVVAWWACFAWLGHRLDKRGEEFIAQLPEVARLLSGGASAGLSIPAAIELTTREIEPPAREELQTVLHELSLGRPLAETLERLRRRLPSREIAVLMNTLIVQQRSGGDAVSALRELAETLDSRRETNREVRTLMAGAIYTAYIVPCLGLFSLVLLNTINSHTLPRMTSNPIGIAALVVAGTIYVVCVHLDPPGHEDRGLINPALTGLAGACLLCGGSAWAGPDPRHPRRSSAASSATRSPSDAAPGSDADRGGRPGRAARSARARANDRGAADQGARPARPSGRPGGMNVRALCRAAGSHDRARVRVRDPDPGARLVAGRADVPLLGWFGVDVWLSRTGRMRQARLERDMPDFIDILAITVRAGVGYRGALERVATSLAGPPAEEILTTLRQMDLGATRREAVRGAARRATRVRPSIDSCRSSSRPRSSACRWPMPSPASRRHPPRRPADGAGGGRSGPCRS